MTEVAGVLLNVTREEGRRMAKPYSGVQSRLCMMMIRRMMGLETCRPGWMCSGSENLYVAWG